MTVRRIISYGLIAGLRIDEMMPLSPGMVCDLYIYRLQYDDVEHGIKRKKQQIYD